MKNWKKGMIAGSIICIAAGFLFIGIGSSMGGWKNIDQINSRYIHFGVYRFEFTGKYKRID